LGYLNVLNSTLAVAALFVIAAIVVLFSICSEYTSVSYNSIIPAALGYMAIAASVIFIVLSYFICLCSLEAKRIIRVFLTLTQLIVGNTSIALGMSIIGCIEGYLKNIATTPISELSWGLSPGILGIQRNMADYALGLNKGCCSETTSSQDISICNEEHSIGPCYLNHAAYMEGYRKGGADLFQQNPFCGNINAPCGDQHLQQWLDRFSERGNAIVVPIGTGIAVVGCIFVLAFFPVICSRTMKMERRSKERSTMKKSLIITDYEDELTADEFDETSRLLPSDRQSSLKGKEDDVPDLVDVSE